MAMLLPIVMIAAGAARERSTKYPLRTRITDRGQRVVAVVPWEQLFTAYRLFRTAYSGPASGRCFPLGTTARSPM